MKNYRKIKIDSTDYNWKVRSKSEDLVYIGIWKVDSSGAKLNVKLKFDDPWLNYGPIITSSDPDKIKEVFNTKPIMPAEVKSLIISALDYGWEPDMKGAELYLIWDRDEKEFKNIGAEAYKKLKTFYSGNKT